MGPFVSWPGAVGVSDRVPGGATIWNERDMIKPRLQDTICCDVCDKDIISADQDDHYECGDRPVKCEGEQCSVQHMCCECAFRRQRWSAPSIVGSTWGEVSRVGIILCPSCAGAYKPPEWTAQHDELTIRSKEYWRKRHGGEFCFPNPPSSVPVPYQLMFGTKTLAEFVIPE